MYIFKEKINFSFKSLTHGLNSEKVRKDHKMLHQQYFSNINSAHSMGRIFSEIDEQLDFYETLVNSSVLNVVSINDIHLLRKSLLKKYSAFKVIYFVCNSEENKTLIFHIIILHASKNLSVKNNSYIT